MNALIWLQAGSASERDGSGAAVPNGGSPQVVKSTAGGDLHIAAEDTFRDLCRLAQVACSCLLISIATSKRSSPAEHQEQMFPNILAFFPMMTTPQRESIASM